MGMFDEVYVHALIELPGFPVSENRVFQTKDFNCLLERYAITDTGRLTKEDCIFDSVPEEDRPYYNDPEYSTHPFMKHMGAIKKTVSGIIDTNFNGDITFYTMLKSTWFEYTAVFVLGVLLEIKKVWFY